MKTTVELADTLLEDAREIVAKEGTTLRNLLEAGLREQVERRKSKPTFRLRRVSFSGEGLLPELEGADWKQIRALAYEGHGG